MTPFKLVTDILRRVHAVDEEKNGPEEAEEGRGRVREDSSLVPVQCPIGMYFLYKKNQIVVHSQVLNVLNCRKRGTFAGMGFCTFPSSIFLKYTGESVIPALGNPL
jgi:hypothetical protein